MQQWHGYDEQYDTLSTWLKDTEVKVRTQAGLQPNLLTKQQQQHTFKVVDFWQHYIIYLKKVFFILIHGY